MTNGKKDPVTVEQTQISYVDEYIYLGQLISPEDNINKEVEKRIAKGWKKYWGAKEIMKDKNLHISTKSKLFNTCILPVLTYGSETWALTRNIAKKLSTCQHAMERSMVGIKRKDKVRNSNIRSKTKVQDITLKIRRQKWKWAGHMIRGKDKWSKIITQWYPRDGKKKERTHPAVIVRRLGSRRARPVRVRAPSIAGGVVRVRRRVRLRRALDAARLGAEPRGRAAARLRNRYGFTASVDAHSPRPASTASSECTQYKTL
ncbi:Putative uncharacterized transposon-derived protein F52C9.6 [Eumeta japonica]|uniref:Uncharacterized transposon-derived protein F52C9.6 n=1 Tax=Eumeta variegata TaxID=151549 RepID=A0A4C1UFD9_EUMVA|nr:Putative uncharacterized transposon-derived protein F52C9.6 [Eumeta japonica]